MQNDNSNYLAPPWIKYPTSPKQSDFWKDGSGAEYLLKYKETISDEDEYLKIFPKSPTFSDDIEASDKLSKETREFLKSSLKPLFIKLWRPDGKPKYDVDFNNTQNPVLMYDVILKDTSAHIHIGNREYHSAEEIITLTKEEFKDLPVHVWEELKYTVYLNALFYKISTDIRLMNEMITKKDKEILFTSDNLEWGLEKKEDGTYKGQNLIGLAMMEMRDVIIEVYENYELIDWEISGEPYSRNFCKCMVHKH